MKFDVSLSVKKKLEFTRYILLIFLIVDKGCANSENLPNSFNNEEWPESVLKALRLVLLFSVKDTQSTGFTIVY